ncbi:MAG: fabG [Planctomycetaceae bacterium]|nr:fabG [Planctomycetaceae bacterium]
MILDADKEVTMMTKRIFDGRIAVVTGGARGIGKAISLMLAREGARVAINYERNSKAAGETLKQIQDEGGDGIIVQADVASESDVQRMFNFVREKLGSVELLVNNAGIAETVPHAAVTFASWKRMLAVNLDGTFLTTWAVKDEMLERRFGRIVNIASLAGLVKKKDMIHYATAKAAVIAFTRHCAEAFAPNQVRVNCLAPGLTETDLAKSANPEWIEKLIAVTPLGRIGQPEEMAAVTRFLLSDDSSFITGQTISACGGRN